MSVSAEFSAAQGRAPESAGNSGNATSSSEGSFVDDTFPPPATSLDLPQDQNRGPNQDEPDAEDAMTAAGASQAQANGKGSGGGSTTTSAAWEDQFNRTTIANPTRGKQTHPRWAISNRQAPGYKSGNHLGMFDPTHASIQDGRLVLMLTQETGTVDSNANGVLSYGAEIYTQDTYGYGTYQWRVRMSSTATTALGNGVPKSGGVSAAFNYVNNSETEIDFEFSGHVLAGASPPNQPTLNDETLYMVNWNNVTPADGPYDSEHFETSAVVSGVTSGFHTYKFIWKPGEIYFYIDDVLKAYHTNNVPSAPARFFMNHWGTNSAWGGAASLDGVPRYFYIDWVKYTPLP